MFEEEQNNNQFGEIGADNQENDNFMEDNTGGFGAQMGLDDQPGNGFNFDDGNGDIGQMELEMLNEVGNIDGEEKTIPIQMFIDMDEDDPNENKIDCNQLFQREDSSKQFFIDLKIKDHYNVKEMVVEAIDLFNERLRNIGSSSQLDDNQEIIQTNFNVYIAKKKGTVKDDYPALSFNSNVKKLTYERYCLCCNTSAFENKNKEFASVQNEAPLAAAVPSQNSNSSTTAPAAVQQISNPIIQNEVNSGGDIQSNNISEQSKKPEAAIIPQSIAQPDRFDQQPIIKSKEQQDKIAASLPTQEQCCCITF